MNILPLFRNRNLLIATIIGLLLMLINICCVIPSYSEVNARPNRDVTPILDVTLETSRPYPTAGTGLGITALLQNVSDSHTIYLRENDMTLSLPPELEGPFGEMTGWFARFPTEMTDNEKPFGKIILQPGDKYQVNWTRNPASQITGSSFLSTVLNQIRTELKFVLFSPGDYKIMVETKYWTDSNFKGPYRTVTQSKILHVTAPQFVILFGASIGGLIAYFLLPMARQRLLATVLSLDLGVIPLLKRSGGEVVGAVGACLLSAIVTILLSRLAETQFLIRVTVNDVWGAIAIGFVANYSGSQVLSRIIPLEKTKKSKETNIKHSAPTENKEDISSQEHE